MKEFLIVYYTLIGGTLQMARAPAVGGYLFACPENLAAMAGVMKDFFDRSYYPVLERLQGRPYAVLICAGSDGTNAARQIERIATGWPRAGSGSGPRPL